MARGNVCPSGDYEGVYYIPTEYVHVYRKQDPDDPYGETEAETCRLCDVPSMDDTWVYDDVGTSNEEEDVLACFMDTFTGQFPSFNRVGEELWLTSSRRALMENRLFYIAVEDNEWALAIELIQKDEGSTGMQAYHYHRYLSGIKEALLERLPRIGYYTGAWTHGLITKEELK